MRAVALSLATAFFYILWLSGTPMRFLSRRALYRWRNFNFRTWAKSVAFLLGMKIRVKGTPPQAPFFLVSNHLSYMDIIAFAARVDSVFVAKSDVAGWPVLGLLSRSIGTIFVRRDLKKDVLRVNALIQQALAEKKGVLLFPEGTSTNGAEVLPFRPALLEPAVRASYPVSYASILYATPAGEAPAAHSVCWWGDMTFMPHFRRLLRLKSFEVTLFFGAHSVRADDRKQLARQLREAVQQQFSAPAHRWEPCKPVAL
jgi:1-acyl-sn-glycerol-3-phosphate acyltransferase